MCNNIAVSQMGMPSTQSNLQQCGTAVLVLKYQSVLKSGKLDRVRILTLSANCILESDFPMTFQSFKDYVNNLVSC